MPLLSNSIRSSSILITMNNIGALLLNLGRYEEAMECLKDAASLRIKALKSNTTTSEDQKENYQKYREKVKNKQELEENQNGFSNWNSVLDLYQLSEDKNEEDIGFSDALLTDYHDDDNDNMFFLERDTAITLYNMGLVHHHKGSFNTAMNLFRMSLVAISDVNCSDVSIIVLHNIAQIQYRRGLYNEAIESFGEALKHGQQGLQKINQADDSQKLQIVLREKKHLRKCMAMTLSGIGRIYFKSGHLDRALEMCNNTVALYKDLYGIDSFHVAMIHYNMGLILYQKQEKEEYPKAIRFYQQFCQKACTVLGNEQHPHILKSLQTMAMMQSELNQYESAKRNLTACLEAKKQIYGENHPLIAGVLCDLGCVHQSAGNLNDALYYYDQAIQIYSTEQEQNELVIKVLCHMAQIYKMKQELHQALVIYQLVLQKSKAFFGEMNEFIADLYSMIGGILLKIGEEDEALASYAESERIRMALSLKDLTFGDWEEDGVNDFSLAPAA